jgi:hypothetical protein
MTESIRPQTVRNGLVDVKWTMKLRAKSIGRQLTPYGPFM